eukprot:g4899.t1
MDLQSPNVGSRGHPDSCGNACKFIKRKGGCRYGAACPDCHLCFWTRSTIRDHHSLFALPLPFEQLDEDGASFGAVDDDTASASSWLSLASSKIWGLSDYQKYPWAKSKGTCEGGKNCGNACRRGAGPVRPRCFSFRFSDGDAYADASNSTRSRRSRKDAITITCRGLVAGRQG